MKNNHSNKILFLASNPQDTARIRLDEEFRKIAEGLERSKYRHRIILKAKFAVRIPDIRRAMLDFKPSLVHFSGHGKGIEGLVFENDQGESQLINAQSLENFFKLFSDHLKCVLLNACHTIIQAKSIGYHIDYVIGMKKGIKDNSAIEFAVAFYDALGSGKPIDFAFDIACNAIQMSGASDHFVPTLITPNFKELYNKLTSLSPGSSALSTRKISEEIYYDYDPSLISEFIDLLELSFNQMNHDPATQYWLIKAIGKAGTNDAKNILYKLINTCKEKHPLVEFGFNEALDNYIRN